MSYKDEQRKYRELSRPKMVPAEEWDKHDKLFMEKGTPWPRKKRRQINNLKDRDFTKPNVDYRMNRKLNSDGSGQPPWLGHVVNDYSYQRHDGMPTMTNHQRHLLRRKVREVEHAANNIHQRQA